MLPAQEALKAALNSIELKTPVIPVHSNVDGKRYRDADHLKKQLPKQICAPVKWEQTMHILYTRSQGITFPKTLECGPGTLLCSILEKVNAKAYENSFNVNT